MFRPLQYIAGTIRKNKAAARLALACVPDIHWTIQVENIGKLRIRIRRNRSLWLRSPLTLEWYPLAVLKSFVKPSDVVWDVGANLGLYARWLVSHLNARQVVSFEPMSDNLPELAYNLELGKISDRVIVVPCALSDIDGEVAFQVDDVQSASGTVDAVYGGEACRARAAVGLPPKLERVKSRTLDCIWAEGILPMPDVIKLDVEGAERLFLNGGKKFFSEMSPRMLIETHGLDVSRQCLEFLFDHGFAVAACVPAAWHPNRHMRLERDVLERMTDQYDAHFIMASKNPADLPDHLDYKHL